MKGGVFCIILCIVILGFSVWAIEADNANFRAFAKEHNCKVVGKVKGGIATGIGSNGTLTTFVEDDKTGYACDDGITYWR